VTPAPPATSDPQASRLPRASGEPLLRVEDLRVSLPTEDGLVHAVDGISFTVEAGRTLGIVGESGSGKSVAALSVIGLTRRMGARISGRIVFEGRDLLSLPEEEMRALRGEEIAMVFQDPLSSLHPLYKVGAQLVEAVHAHHAVPRREARRRAVELLGQVGIPEPARRADQYPHELSGGMRQRAMIAMALINDPKLLIADEPTTALDVTVQAQLLALLERLQGELSMAIVLITHDLGVIAETAQDVAVMYAGRLVETAPVEALFAAPEHPYTWGLLRSMPRLDAPRRSRLVPIAGSPPSLIKPPSGCHFHPRCPHARPEHARRDPSLEAVPGTPSHQVACLLDPATRRALWAQLGAQAPTARRAPPTPAEPLVAAGGAGAAPGAPASAEPLLEVRDLVKHFPLTRGIVFRRTTGTVHAVDGVSFELRRGETLGIVGETGCGKSTVARLVTRLLEPTAGQVRFEGRDLASMSRAELKAMRREMQIVFQDPYSSLNPRKTVGSIIAEPFRVHGLKHSPNERRRAVQELMQTVGLNPEHFNRYPYEFSGGQRQRVGLARALALEPKLLIADEPVSALDVSIQAQVLNLLRDLQQRFGLTLVFISHDLSVVRHMCDRVAVMYLGKFVEIGEGEALYTFPRHPYTGALLGAVPSAEPHAGGNRRLLTGDVPSPTNPPSGCRFHTRCPKATERCRAQEPALASLGSGTIAACHHPLGRDELPALGVGGAPTAAPAHWPRSA